MTPKEKANNRSLTFEFVPYEQALELKELGFNEPCFGFYTEEYKNLVKNFCKYPIDLPTKPFLAPLYQQSFRWLYQKLDIEKGVMPLDIESKQLLLKELIDKVSSKHLLV